MGKNREKLPEHTLHMNVVTFHQQHIKHDIYHLLFQQNETHHSNLYSLGRGGVFKECSKFFKVVFKLLL